MDTPLELHLDGRGRWSHTEIDNKLTVIEAYVGWGGAKDDLRLALGRQVVRAVSSAEVDGLKAEYQVTERFAAFLFGGLMPHPFDNTFETDFVTAGAGYGYRADNGTHRGGAVASMYRGELDRIYFTHRSVAKIDSLLLSGFAMVDLLAPDPLVGGGGDVGFDPTSFHGLVRYRGWELLDTSLSLTHHHTVLPNRWWRDWLNEERRRRGFLIDGDEPVGTRISSVRWTNNLRLFESRAYTPYIRLRYDRRHSDNADGYEGRAGFKWRTRLAFVDTDYTYRRYFNSDNQLIGLRGGYDDETWGGEGGLVALHANPRATGRAASWSYQAHGLAYLSLGELLLDQPVLVQAQYLVFIEPDAVYHTFFAQIGYRL